MISMHKEIQDALNQMLADINCDLSERYNDMYYCDYEIIAEYGEEA